MHPERPGHMVYEYATVRAHLNMIELRVFGLTMNAYEVWTHNERMYERTQQGTVHGQQGECGSQVSISILTFPSNARQGR